MELDAKKTKIMTTTDIQTVNGNAPISQCNGEAFEIPTGDDTHMYLDRKFLGDLRNRALVGTRYLFLAKSIGNDKRLDDRCRYAMHRPVGFAGISHLHGS